MPFFFSVFWERSDFWKHSAFAAPIQFSCSKCSASLKISQVQAEQSMQKTTTWFKKAHKPIWNLNMLSLFTQCLSTCWNTLLGIGCAKYIAQCFGDGYWSWTPRRQRPHLQGEHGTSCPSKILQRPLEPYEPRRSKTIPKFHLLLWFALWIALCSTAERVSSIINSNRREPLWHFW